MSEDRGLSKSIGRTLAARMIGITFDLDRAALKGLCEKAGRDAAKRHRGRKEIGLPGSIPSGIVT